MARLAQLKVLLEKNPTDSFLLFAIAKEYEGRNEPDNAKASYLKIVDSAPNYVGVYYHLGKLYEALGEDLKALDIYQKGINVAVQQGDTHAKNELAGAKLNLEMEL